MGRGGDALDRPRAAPSRRSVCAGTPGVVFDARGKQTHRLQARELGSPGSAVAELFPLERGGVLAFAPYPRGEALLVDFDGSLLGRWLLDRFYTGGNSYLAERGDHVVFTHSRENQVRVLQLRR